MSAGGVTRRSPAALAEEIREALPHVVEGSWTWNENDPPREHVADCPGCAIEPLAAELVQRLETAEADARQLREALERLERYAYHAIVDGHPSKPEMTRVQGMAARALARNRFLARRAALRGHDPAPQAVEPCHICHGSDEIGHAVWCSASPLRGHDPSPPLTEEDYERAKNDMPDKVAGHDPALTAGAAYSSRAEIAPRTPSAPAASAERGQRQPEEPT